MGPFCFANSGRRKKETASAGRRVGETVDEYMEVTVGPFSSLDRIIDIVLSMVSNISNIQASEKWEVEKLWVVVRGERRVRVGATIS